MKAARIYNKDGNYAKTCPNCGAAIESDKCAYCGTTFIDFACIDTEKPFYMKIKNGAIIHIAEVMLTSATIDHDFSNGYCFNGNNFAINTRTKLNISFDVLNFYED